MLTIIHGSDTAASRKYFLEERQRHTDSLLLDADKIDLTHLAQIFEGGGLFGETKYVFIEQFLTKRKKSADLKQILTYLQAKSEDNDIVLWEGKDLEPSALKPFTKPLIKAFKLPQTLFTFLEALKPSNGPRLVGLFRQTIATAETEMVFFMLTRQIRLLLALCSQSSSRAQRSNPPLNKRVYEIALSPSASRNEVVEIDELKRMAPWQKNKMVTQASFFTQSQLIDIYDKLYRIEVGQKTGTLAVPIVSAIDFLLFDV